MHPVVEAQRTKLPAACSRYGVRRLEVFGSAARHDFDPRTSDLDFLVEFDGSPVGKSFDAYFGLKEELESIFQRPVDLIEPGAVRNPYLLAAMQRDRQLVYEA